MTTKQQQSPDTPRHTKDYFSAPDDFGVYSCADDYEDAQRYSRQINEEEMP